MSPLAERVTLAKAFDRTTPRPTVCNVRMVGYDQIEPDSRVTLTGFPGVYLVVGLAGGGGLLLAAAWLTFAARARA